jgi:bifunctional DNA-binding transcriptional regulator/antitoxin component of YhaV-PrlF toxin-antitoxin module
MVIRGVRSVRAEGKERFGMELTKVTFKGQITIPVDVRRKPGEKRGDKDLFVEDRDALM